MDEMVLYIIMGVISLIVYGVKKGAENLEKNSNNSNTPQRTPQRSLIKCPSCFFPNPSDSSFCIACGQRLKKEQPKVTKKVSSPPPIPEKEKETVGSIQLKNARNLGGMHQNMLQKENEPHPLFQKREDILQAIILKEILDKPISQRGRH